MQSTVQCTPSHGHICKKFINAGYDLQHLSQLPTKPSVGFWGKGCTVMKAFQVLHIIYYISTFHQLFCLLYLYVAPQNTHDVTMGPDRHMLPNFRFWRWMTEIKTDPTYIGCNDKWCGLSRY